MVLVIGRCLCIGRTRVDPLHSAAGDAGGEEHHGQGQGSAATQEV
jgi:hypothetical protein